MNKFWGNRRKWAPAFLWETPTISLKKGKNASILAPEMRISASTEPMNIPVEHVIGATKIYAAMAMNWCERVG